MAYFIFCLGMDCVRVNTYSLSDAVSELDYSVADAYFAETEQNTESLLQNDISYAEVEEDNENKISTLSTSVSYNQKRLEIGDIN